MAAAVASVALPPTALPLAEDAVLERTERGHRVRYRFELPYFALLWRPLLARRAREIEIAADAGRPLPEGVPWWAPPAPQSLRASATVAAACLISGTWSYAGGTGGLATQTLPYAADTYDVGDSELGTGLAIIRLGVLVALVLGLAADRMGRRRFILTAAVAHCLLAAVIGLMPSFAAYVGAHLALRCIDTALSIALGVLAIESVPAANRATTLAMVVLANGVGLSLAVGALPIAAAGRGGFATVYVLQLLALPLILHAARRLDESPRFVRHAAERHRYRELLAPPYGKRVIVVGGAAALAALFFAPGIELFNRYLDDEHGFSAFEIVLFLAVTGAPSFAMLAVGGKAADFFGRKRVGIPLVCAATLAYAGFYLAGGVLLWVLAFTAAMLGSAGGAALATFRSELFPTRVRAAANTVVVAATVVGSSAGLLAAGAMSGEIGIGPAIAVLGAGPLLAAVITARWFPETARRELEETAAESVRA